MIPIDSSVGDGVGRHSGRTSAILQILAKVVLTTPFACCCSELNEKAFRRLGGVSRVIALDNLREGVLASDIYDPPSILCAATCCSTIRLFPCRAEVAVNPTGCWREHKDPAHDILQLNH